jgi:hypothetical protein
MVNKKQQTPTCPDCDVELVRDVLVHELGCPSDSEYLGDSEFTDEEADDYNNRFYDDEYE